MQSCTKQYPMHLYTVNLLNTYITSMQVHPALESRASKNIPHFWLITRIWSFFVLRPSFNPFPFLFWGQKVASVYSFWQFTLSGDRRVLHNGFGIQLFPEVLLPQVSPWASFTAKRGGTFASMASSCKLRAKILISCYLWQCVIVSHFSVSLGLMFFYAVTVVRRPTWEIIETKKNYMGSNILHLKKYK